MDGCTPAARCAGALSSGDIELLEYAYPIIIHRYGLQQDRRRRQHRSCWPIGHDRGGSEGRQIPTGGAAGAYNSLPERKLGRLEHRHADARSPRIARTPS